MRATSACLVARGARRERCGNLRAAWVLCLMPLWRKGLPPARRSMRPSASTNCHHLTLTSRLPPPATCRPRLPLPRRNHRSTLLSGVIPGRGSSAASCRPTRSAPHSNQSVTLLTRSGCSLGNPMSLVGSVKRSRDSSRADSNSVKE